MAALAEAIATHIAVTRNTVTLVDVAPDVMVAPTRERLGSVGLHVVQTVEAADILVIGSPIYRASYTGALKHLFDFVNYRALAGTVAVVAATGGTALHALALEHQFRPLLGFFGILGVPTTVYALESDFDGTTLVNEQVRARIEQAAAEAAALAPLAVSRRTARAAAA